MRIGVTNIISELSNPIDWDKKAKEKAKREGIPVNDILNEWDKKRQLGIDIHKKIMDKELLNNDNAVFEGRTISESNGVDNITYNSLIKNNTTYYEKYINSKCGIHGFIDKVEVKNNKIIVYDLKVKNTLYFSSSYKANNGFKVEAKKMLGPLSHLDDCNGVHATLQLSLYMYILWENNKNLKPSKLYIRHIKTTDNGKISSDELIEVPYLRKEVKEIIKYWKLNCD